MKDEDNFCTLVDFQRLYKQKDLLVSRTLYLDEHPLPGLHSIFQTKQHPKVGRQWTTTVSEQQQVNEVSVFIQQRQRIFVLILHGKETRYSMAYAWMTCFKGCHMSEVPIGPWVFQSKYQGHPMRQNRKKKKALECRFPLSHIVLWSFTCKAIFVRGNT